MNPLWTRIHRFIWSTMIRVISDHWSWSGSYQRNAPKDWFRGNRNQYLASPYFSKSSVTYCLSKGLRVQKQVQAQWYTQGLNIRRSNMADVLLQLGFTLSRFTLVNSVSVHGRKGSFPFLASSSFVLAFVLLVWASSNPPGNFTSQGNRSNVCFHCCEISPYVRTRVNVTPLNETETMYGRWRAYVKVKTRSTFTFILGLSYIAPVSFTHLTFTCAHTEKLRDSGNKPKHT